MPPNHHGGRTLLGLLTPSAMTDAELRATVDAMDQAMDGHGAVSVVFASLEELDQPSAAEELVAQLARSG